MRVAYVIHAYGRLPSGVASKVRMQLKIWREQGVDAALFLVVRQSAQLMPEFDAISEVNLKTATYSNTAGRIGAIYKLWHLVKEWRPDLVYHRFDLYHPAIVSMSVKVPIVVEINSDDIKEYRSQSITMHLLNLVTRRRLLKCASGLAFISRELSSMTQFMIGDISKIVIGNGILLDEFKRLNLIPHQPPTAVFIGSARYPWHGTDKLVALAGQLPDWQFKVLGETAADNFVDLPSNVHLHGAMEALRYYPILSHAHVAFSSLALERVGIGEASPLKSREYLALGLPVIQTYSDTDFPGRHEFLLQLSAGFDPGDPSVLESLRRFMTRWQGQRVARDDIKRIDMKSKEVARLQFFTEVLESRRTKCVSR